MRPSIVLGAAADAAQEPLIVIFKALRGLREPAALHGWVKTIAVREAIRVARADARSVPDDLSYLPAPGDQLLGADIAQSLANLTPEHRAVLVLRDLEGYSEQETAELLRVSPLESWRVALCGLVLQGAGG